jgi:CBS domain-containing protein
MAKDRISVTEDTSIDEVVKIMEEKRLLNLPGKINATVAYSITRHDYSHVQCPPPSVSLVRLSARENKGAR